MNRGPSGLVLIVPLTSVKKGIPSHIPILPPDGGLNMVSYALCEQIRSISKQRMVKKLGKISSTETLTKVRQWILDLTNITT